MTWTLAQGRPRVLVTSAQLPALRRLAETTHRKEMQSLLALPGTLAKSRPANPDDGAHATYRLAFLHLLTQDPAHASACAQALERILAADVSAGYFEAQRRLKALACAYDWCHDALSPMFLERIGHCALAYAHALYVNHEVYPKNYLAGHEVNHVPYMLLATVAIGDEVFGAPALLEHLVPRLEQMLRCYGHFLEGDSFSQSYSYTGTYLMELPVCFQGMEAAFGLDWFAEHAWLRNGVKWWTYALRDDETFIRHGDYFCSSPLFRSPGYWRAFAAVAKRYRDGLAQWWLNRFTVRECEPDAFIFEERENPPAPESPASLPRTKLFPPMGVAIARGDWAGGTVAAFKCTPVYLHNHCHRDQNQITIYHKGDLAIDSGAYDGYETAHWYNYYIRTIAHNTVVVHDPDEKMISRGVECANDGGQHFVNAPDFAPRSFEDLTRAEFQDGRIVAYGEGEGWSYVCGDASRCYSSRKLKRFWRHVVFVLDWPNTSAVSLVVLDDIELARPGLTPRFLLHTMERPEVSGARIVAREGGGRLTTHVLLPQAARVEAIGGEGKEFVVDGRNFAMIAPLTGPHTPGEWRVEVAPAAADATRVRFLTLLVPADADAPPEPAPQVQVSGGNLVVTQGELSVGLFEKAGALALSGKRAVEVVAAK